MVVDNDRRLSAGDTAPDCVLACIEEALDWVLVVEGLTIGGRIECFLLGRPGRGRPAIDFLDTIAKSTQIEVSFVRSAMNWMLVILRY